MNLQPVIQRELRVASRRRETWRLRLAFGGGAMAAFAFGMLLPHISSRERGATVLVCLAICGFVLSLFTGAYLTADAVTSEKREGTLGLLFLTPLNGWEIVLGKMLTHSLQVGYALLGGFPLFFLPLLLGGVVWGEVARLLLVMLVTLLLSLACGMLWSTVATEARGAVLGTTFSMILLTFLPWLWPFVESLLTRRGPHLAGLPQLSPMTQLIFAFESNFRLARPPGLPISSGAFIYWGSLGCNLVWSLLLLGAAGWLLPRIWRRAEAGGPSARSSEPAWGAVVPRKSLPRWAPALDAAPLLWLAVRGLREPRALWLARGATLVFLGLMLVLSVTTRSSVQAFIAAFCAAYGLHLLMRIQLALTATSRLHEDRRSGALEILLVAPVNEADLVQAHHESLKLAFRRPLLILLAINSALELTVILFPGQLKMTFKDGVIFTVFFAGGALITLADFTTLRWLSLCESMRHPTQLKAAGKAFGLMVAVAWSTFAAAWVVAIQTRRTEGVISIFGLWVVARLVCDWVLIRRCRHWLGPGLRRRVAEGFGS